MRSVASIRRGIRCRAVQVFAGSPPAFFQHGLGRLVSRERARPRIPPACFQLSPKEREYRLQRRRLRRTLHARARSRRYRVSTRHPLPKKEYRMPNYSYGPFKDRVSRGLINPELRAKLIARGNPPFNPNKIGDLPLTSGKRRRKRKAKKPKA